MYIPLPTRESSLQSKKIGWSCMREYYTTFWRSRVYDTIICVTLDIIILLEPMPTTVDTSAMHTTNLN